MTTKEICRIGVFYDGSFFSYSQRFLYHNRKLGWLDFRAFHSLVQEYVRSKEQGYSTYKVVYASWFQGLYTSVKAEEKQLRLDRNHYHDLMHAGIEAKFLPMSTSQGEKGTDVALAVDALQIGLAGKIDVAVLVTGDGDFVPLVHELMKNGVRVLIAYFEYKEGDYRSYANERLLASANYELNVNAMEHSKDFKSSFKALFKQSQKGAKAAPSETGDTPPDHGPSE